MVGGSLHRSLKKETQISYFQMLALKSTFFFLLIPDAFLILPGIGRGEFSIFLSLSLSLSCYLLYFKYSKSSFQKFVFVIFIGLADAPPALRHLNSDASEDDVFMASYFVHWSFLRSNVLISPCLRRLWIFRWSEVIYSVRPC